MMPSVCFCFGQDMIKIIGEGRERLNDAELSNESPDTLLIKINPARMMLRT